MTWLYLIYSEKAALGQAKCKNKKEATLSKNDKSQKVANNLKGTAALKSVSCFLFYAPFQFQNNTLPKLK